MLRDGKVGENIGVKRRLMVSFDSLDFPSGLIDVGKEGKALMFGPTIHKQQLGSLQRLIKATRLSANSSLG